VRVKLWAEHLRTGLSDELTPLLTDLDTALGIWRAQWLPADHPRHTWRRAGSPDGFAPAERVLIAARCSAAMLRRETRD